MLVDIKRDRARTKILLILDGQGISNLSDAAAEFLDDLVFETQVDTDRNQLPLGLNNDEVMTALRNRGYYAATYSANLVEVEIQER